MPIYNNQSPNKKNWLLEFALNQIKFGTGQPQTSRCIGMVGGLEIGYYLVIGNWLLII
jgi:hypothetical protein